MVTPRAFLLAWSTHSLLTVSHLGAVGEADGEEEGRAGGALGEEEEDVTYA